MAMTPEVQTCPYCNTQLLWAVQNVRLICPRCGETIPLQVAFPEENKYQVPPLLTTGESADSGNVSRQRGLVLQIVIMCILLAGTSLALKLALPENNTTQRGFPFMVLLSCIGLVASLWIWFFQKHRRNSAAAVFVLANMLAIALMVLPFALATKTRRRDNDPKGPPTLPTSPATKTKPLAPKLWAALGYLPEDFNLVVGIHVSDLANNPMGAKLLAGMASPDGEQRTDLIELAVRPVEKFTGLKPDALDHLVLGMRLDAGLPVVMIVARTREPYDSEVLRQAQAPATAVKYLDRDLYRFNTKPLGTGMLFAADPQTMILVIRVDPLAERDKQMLITVPRNGAKGPPQALRGILGNPVFRPGTSIWWAGADIQQPEVAVALFPLAQKNAELAKLVGLATSVVGGLYLHDDAALVGYVQCPDPISTERLEAVLRKQTPAGNLGVGAITSGRDNAFWFRLYGTPEEVTANLQGVRLLGRFPGKK
jgi:hypothetical protein